MKSAKKTVRSRKRKIRTKYRVFLLGAGVSASCGIAVAKDILRESVIRLAKANEVNAAAVHNLLQYLYADFAEELQNYPNIEDFLNLLEMAKIFNSEVYIKSSLWPREKLRQARDITIKSVTDYIWGLMDSKERLQTVRDFVRHCIRKGDVIITFNWDVSLERALEDEGHEFWYEFPYSHGVALLKPHGSIDWFEKKKLGGVNIAKTRTLDAHLCLYPSFNFADNPDLRQYAPVIVPPVFGKEFPYALMQKTWRSIYRVLSKATKLYIMGYSLPKEDQFARLVLGRALRNNALNAKRKKKPGLEMTVVNPDETAEVTFLRLAGPDVKAYQFFQTTFENFVAVNDNV